MRLNSLCYIIWTLEVSVESRNKMYLLLSVSHWPVLSCRKLTYALTLVVSSVSIPVACQVCLCEEGLSAPKRCLSIWYLLDID